ncbi:uncharacterized protein [Solanum lycopersicum]|uniref:uncharacterized protein n=1 Tax=Solanum lycopersicum TaxID=4081 RepID=UPI003748D46C
MSRFVMGVSDDFQEECHSAMLHDNMNISRLTVHAKHVEEAKSKRKSRDAKRERTFDRGSSKNRLEIQDKPRFKKWVSNQVPSKFPKGSGDKVSNLKRKKGKGTSSPTENPTCGKCGKKHHGDCLKGTNNYFCCGKSWHKIRYLPNVRGQDKGSGQSQASGSNEAPKKNRFNALCSRGEQDTSPDVVIGWIRHTSL